MNATGLDLPAGGRALRILVTTAPGAGHLFPMVPLAWALRAAGHEVLVATPDSFVGEVLATGLPAIASSGPVRMGEMMSPDRTRPPVRHRGPGPEHVGRGFARLAAVTLPGTEELVDGWRPDLVISETSEYAGPLAAAARGIPVVRHGWGLAITPEADGFAADQLAGELARLGLSGLPRPVGEIDVWPASLQLPACTATDRVRYVPYNGARTTSARLLRRGTRRRICLTLGTTVPRVHGPDLLLDLQRALAGRDVELVIAISDDLAARLDPPGGNTLAVSWQPLALVLPHCDLLVHQGGAGTTLTALAGGLAQVILPHMGDQFDNADRVAGSGAAIRVPRAEVSAETVMAAMDAVLDDPGFTARARALRDEMRREASPMALVPRIERLARRALADR
ncbi:nucleotide disphospho-sugar-binding domain-containing protein [Actinomadura gamaensis]|uniref:Nucleotide disphospho-sugar-binding domain-containing protein n=1 Tax=Actinomadura gamaensis TaxID=1763541 RepID=A0ABV9U3I1_9ACTN